MYWNRIATLWSAIVAVQVHGHHNHYDRTCSQSRQRLRGALSRILPLIVMRIFALASRWKDGKSANTIEQCM